MAVAAAERTIVTDESLEALALDEGAVAEGKKIFTTQCYACHDQGQGRVGLGSNLTDEYWVHGGAPTDIHATVTNGVPEKGMTPWGAILGEAGVSNVTAYVLTMRNTKLEGGKPVEENAVVWAPDGDLVE
jgi:cytochrome c oxidase cbb3-type subunit 3